MKTEAEFLEEIHSFALRFLFLKTHATPYSLIQLLYTVKEKGGKPDRKPYPPPYGLRNPYGNLKSGNPKDYACRTLNEIAHS
jgi:hypothetical protein